MVHQSRPHNRQKNFQWIKASVCFVVMCIVFIFLFGGLTVRSNPPRVYGNNVIPKKNTPIEAANAAYLPFVTRSVDRFGNSIGTMLVAPKPGDWIALIDVMTFANDQYGMKGLITAASPSEYVRDEWFGRLTGWTRVFTRGIYDELEPIYSSAAAFHMQNMYDCISYGPESAHRAGQEALEPLIWVPMAKDVADSTGKCLIYGPAVLDYEMMATAPGGSQPDPVVLANLISSVSPYVDIWMIQLAKYQNWADRGRDDMGNTYTIDDFSNWVEWWIIQLKSGNHHIRVWGQLGIGVYDPGGQACSSPQSHAYIVNYYDALLQAGLDGVYVVPAQPCQSSIDPQDRENYLQTIDAFQQAIQAIGSR